ncbi:hypothetical protein RB195_005225 [Necator americanus]|uniref:TIL domain-containing protein n=1 Tax=Necator americanus TaxID=51031 RepID=A0ABR1BPS3_NECAM
MWHDMSGGRALPTARSGASKMNRSALYKVSTILLTESTYAMKLAVHILIFLTAHIIMCTRGDFLETACGENGTYFSCYNGCEPTCAHPDVACLAVCGGGGCVCKRNFLRNKDGKCVLKEEC